MAKITQAKVALAEERTEATRRRGFAVRARYDRHHRRVVVTLDSGIQITIPVSQTQGLSDARNEDLGEIEVSPSGLGLYWPKLDVDLYVPALLEGILGTESWTARSMGARGGSKRSAAKSKSARENGKKGGRPKKLMVETH